MLNILSVGLGGFVGAVCRYLIGLIPVKEALVFPIKTVGVNILGCLVIGIIAACAAKNDAVSPQLLLFLKVGLCGGFTTFSSFALETTDLMKAGHILPALIYVLGSVLIGVATIFAVEYMGLK